jgi:hypothetical protein
MNFKSAFNALKSIGNTSRPCPARTDRPYENPNVHRQHVLAAPNAESNVTRTFPANPVLPEGWSQPVFGKLFV